VSGNSIYDSSKKEFLAQEHVDEADIVVTTLDSDEKNLLISVLAKRIGVDRVIAVVDNTEYVTLFEEIGIDVAINPREVTAEETLTDAGIDRADAVISTTDVDPTNIMVSNQFGSAVTLSTRTHCVESWSLPCCICSCLCLPPLPHAHSARIGVELTVLESLSASIATIGNIGPGFGDLGPFGSYLFFSDISKPFQCLRYSSQDSKANSPK